MGTNKKCVMVSIDAATASTGYTIWHNAEIVEQDRIFYDKQKYKNHTQYDVQIKPHETIKIGTGLAMEVPDGYFGAIFARSGLASKEGLRPANCVGVCDSDYRGEYIVAIHNDSEETRTVTAGERIAQLVVMPYLPVTFDEVAELTDTNRGEGGFGSTGK